MVTNLQVEDLICYCRTPQEGGSDLQPWHHYRQATLYCYTDTHQVRAAGQTFERISAAISLSVSSCHSPHQLSASESAEWSQTADREKKRNRKEGRKEGREEGRGKGGRRRRGGNGGRGREGGNHVCIGESIHRCRRAVVSHTNVSTCLTFNPSI